MSCPQCEIGPLQCDDAMLFVRDGLGTPEPPANSRKGRGMEWEQKHRIWQRVCMYLDYTPRCVTASVYTEARINRAWLQIAHGMSKKGPPTCLANT